MGPTSGKPLSGVLLVILLAGAKSAEDITITNPGKVALGEKFHLDWESVGATKNDVFDIELYTNAMCSGTPIADLCDESESGCHSAYGGYGVVIPEATGVGEREYGSELPSNGGRERVVVVANVGFRARRNRP